MNDPTLFDFSPHPRYRHTDPETSVLAARSVDAKAVEAQILSVLHGDMTADQIAERLHGVRQDTLRSALSRLKRSGRVVVTGVGVSASGRPMSTVRIA